MADITRFIKKVPLSVNRYDLLADVGKEMDAWCKRYANTPKFKDDVEAILSMSNEQILEEIDKYIIDKIDKQLSKKGVPRMYEPTK